MKNVFLLLAIMLFVLSGWAQTKTDKAQILQKCIDLPELQQIFGTSEISKQIYLQQYPVSFETDLQVSKFNKNFVYMSRKEMMDNKIENFFVFQKFSITGNNAEAVFHHYKDHRTNAKVREITVSLTKTGDVWSVLQSKIIGGN